jgi:MFS transporter, CP family, cyanate transporter
MSEQVAEKASKYRWWILIMASLVNAVVIGLSWMCMPVLFNEISQKMGWSLSELFASWGMIPLAIVFLNIPAGLAGDKFGTRWVPGIGIIIMGISGALRGFSDVYPSFMIWMFLFGATFPFAGVLLPKILGMHFPSKELGMANGVLLGAYGAGAAFSLTFSGTLISGALGGWQNVLYLYGAISLVIGILWLTTVKDKPAITSPGSGHGGSAAGVLLRLIKNPQVLALCAIYFLFTGGWLGVSGAYPALAKEGRNFSPQAAHFVVSLALIAYVAGCFIIPVLSDKLGLRRPVYCIGLLLSGVCMFLACVAGPPMVWIWAALWGLSAGAIPLIFVMPMEMPEVGPAVGGSAIGLIMAVGNLGGFIFPVVIAGLSSSMNPSSALVWIGLLCGIGGYAITGLLIWMIKETGPKARASATEI